MEKSICYLVFCVLFLISACKEPFPGTLPVEEDGEPSHPFYLKAKLVFPDTSTVYDHTVNNSPGLVTNPSFLTRIDSLPKVYSVLGPFARIQHRDQFPAVDHRLRILERDSGYVNGNTAYNGLGVRFNHFQTVGEGAVWGKDVMEKIIAEGKEYSFGDGPGEVQLGYSKNNVFQYFPTSVNSHTTAESNADGFFQVERVEEVKVLSDTNSGIREVSGKKVWIRFDCRMFVQYHPEVEIRVENGEGILFFPYE